MGLAQVKLRAFLITLHVNSLDSGSPSIYRFPMDE